MSLNPYQPPRQLTELPEDIVVAQPVNDEANDVSLWTLVAIVGTLAMFIAVAVAALFGVGLHALIGGIFYRNNVEMPPAIFALIMLVAICGGASVACTMFTTVVFGGKRVVMLIPVAAWVMSTIVLIVALIVDLC